MTPVFNIAEWSRGPCPRSTRNRGHGPRLQRQWALIASLALYPLFTAAAEEPKDHVLFVGTDFSVVIKGQEKPVVDAGNRTFVYQDGGKRQEKPLRQLPDIRMHRGLKLSNASADIEHVKGVLSSDARTFELNQEELDVMAMATISEMKRDEAYGKLLEAELGRAGAGSSQNNSVRGHDATIAAFGDQNGGGIQGDLWKQAMAAEAKHTQDFKFINEAITTTGATTTNDGEEVEITPELTAGGAGLSVSGHLPKLGVKDTKGKTREVVQTTVDAGDGRSDRFDLDFQLSAPRPLDNAYVVITTEYSKPKSAEVFRRVLSQRVGHIDATPRKVSIYETNYPEGFHLRTYFIAVFADGQEVATNLSDTKMTMTREEAYEYISVEYLASHKGKSAPPAAVLMAPKSQFATAVAKTVDVQQPVYVSVDDNGKVTEISADPKHSRPANPAVLAALDNFRFIPALDNGKPVAGRAKIVLADFVQ